MHKPVALLLLIANVCAYAQQAERDAFDAFLKEATADFEDFRTRTNREYAEFLLTNWKTFNASDPVPTPKEPRVTPVRYEDKQERSTNAYGVKAVSAPAEEVPVAAVPVIPQAAAMQYRNISFSLYGLSFSVRVPRDGQFCLPSVSPRDISKSWKTLSGKAYDATLADCLAVKRENSLCDWAYLNFLDTFSGKYASDDNSARFLTAYLLAQSGYKMRLGVDSDRLVFLFGTDYMIYDISFYRINGTRYYVFKNDQDVLSLADIPYPDESSLSLNLNLHQAFGDSLGVERKLVSKRYGTFAHSRASLDRIAFYDGYPSAQRGDDRMSRWALVAEAPLSEQAMQALYPDLRRKIEGKSATEAADILLDFVQTSFSYKQDDEVWGNDRVFFAEETLHYPNSDCEDRAILFSRLVRDLLGLDVVLVHYPGHLATAVRFPELPVGDYLPLPSGNYTICDPTYIGAPIGETMPEMKNKEINVIQF